MKSSPWDRLTLFEKGFFYDEDIATNDLPRHIETLRQSILDFAYEDFDLRSEKDTIAATQHLAKCHSESGVSEETWKIFFRERFFNPLVQNVSISHDSRRVSRCNYYYDSIVVDSEASWVTFDVKGKRLGSSMSDPFENNRAPKPDCGFYFPIYHLTAKIHIPATANHKALQWHKASTPSLVESFSLSVLQNLHGHGLRPSPFNAFMKGAPEKDLKCFPWLVVEHKKEQKSERLKMEAYCQAVNASGCAVRLNQIAAKYAVGLVGEAHVPPVPAVTTVGPEVKVWITYFAKDFMAYQKAGKMRRWHGGGYNMQCIWEGDMTEPRDIVQFRLILENTYTWATRVFKPLMTTYIDQWRFVYSDGGLNSSNVAMGTREHQTNLEADDDLLIRLLQKLIKSEERRNLIQEIIAQKDMYNQRADSPNNSGHDSQHR